MGPAPSQSVQAPSSKHLPLRDRTPLPAIALWDSRDDSLRVVREFGYETFRDRLS